MKHILVTLHVRMCDYLGIGETIDLLNEWKSMISWNKFFPKKAFWNLFFVQGSLENFFSRGWYWFWFLEINFSRRRPFEIYFFPRKLREFFSQGWYLFFFLYYIASSKSSWSSFPWDEVGTFFPGEEPSKSFSLGFLHPPDKVAMVVPMKCFYHNWLGFINIAQKPLF